MSSCKSLGYAGCAYPIEGLGPGRRLVAWVRGCGRRCAGCMAADLWGSGPQTPVEQVADELLPPLSKLGRLTVSGGEPFDQAPALAALVGLLRSKLDMEIAVYTGYLLPELDSMGGSVGDLLRLVDIVIDGPYLEGEDNTLLWRGSDNQRVHLLSERAQKYSAMLRDTWPEVRPLHIQPLGASRYRLVGIPRRDDLEVYRRAMAARGLEVRPDDVRQ